MTPQASKPSGHNVIIGSWTPSAADTSAGRVPGYGVITNIINGGLECGQGSNDKVADRIGFYKRSSMLFMPSSPSLIASHLGTSALLKALFC
nr:endochitinase [Quercus suber]